MTRKQRRELRQANKVARSVERIISHNALRTELKELRIGEIHPAATLQKQMEQLEDSHCLGVLAGVASGLPTSDVNQILREYEIPLVQSILRQSPRRPAY